MNADSLPTDVAGHHPATGVLSADDALADLWQAAAESSEDAVFGIDDRGFVHTWSRSAARLFDEDVAEPQRGPISRVLAGERIDRLRVDVRRNDGMVVPVSLTLVPLAAGRGCCVLARDRVRRHHGCLPRPGPPRRPRPAARRP